MTLPFVFAVTIFFFVAFYTIVIVFAGGYRWAHNEALLRQYKAAQQEFLEIRKAIRRRHTAEIIALHRELQGCLERRALSGRQRDPRDAARTSQLTSQHI